MNFIHWLWIFSVCFCIHFHLVDSQDQCTKLTNDGLTDGEVFEKAATDTWVTTLGIVGDIGVDILLDLTGNLDLYFKLDGKNVTVKDSATLDRTSSGLENPSLAESIDITGTVQCSIINGSLIPRDARVRMRYINKYPPIITSDGSTNQSEYIGVGAVVPFQVTSAEAAGGNDPAGESTILEITSQDPPGFFAMTDEGVLTVAKDLDYTKYQQHIINLKVTNTGFNSAGGSEVFTATEELTINIEDYDDLPPLFQPCDGDICQPLYSVNVTVGEAASTLNVEPGPINAIDADTGIDSPISYSFISGVPTDYATYFSIASDTGVVTLLTPVPKQTTYTIAVKAEQTDRADRFSVTYLQVKAIAKDEFPPTFTETLYNGEVVDDGSEILFVYEIGTSNLLQLIAKDEDPNSVIIYQTTTPSDYQISSEGYIFTRNLPGTTRASATDLEIVAINVNAEIDSDNRQSEPIILSVEVIEVTTQQTTEATTEPVTTEASTTAEPTTPEPTTTFVETSTVMVTSPEPTTVPATTPPDTTTEEITTAPITTTIEITTAPETTTEAITTAPITTTVETTTVPETTTDEITTAPITTTVESTSQADTTTAEITTNPTSIALSTSEQTTKTDLTTVTTDTTSKSQATTDSDVSNEVSMVPASTLYGVAAGLSVALFIAILAIIYLIWRLMKKNKEKDFKEDEKSLDDESMSENGNAYVYQNGAYAENETNAKEIDERPPPAMVTFTGNTAETDYNGDGTNVNEETGSNYSSHVDLLGDEPVATDFSNNHPYENIQDNMNEQEHLPDDDMMGEVNYDDEPELPMSDFERELLQKREAIAATAAAAVVVNEALHSDTESIPDRDLKDFRLPPEIIRDERIIKEDVVTTVKLVTLKGYGDDKEDVKAVLKSTDLDMATDTEQEALRSKIKTMEELAELDHENILKFYGSYEKDGWIHYATKYAENGCLQDKLRNSNMDSNTMMHIMADIGKGLQYLHAKNIIHGKLWGKSIMLDAQNKPKLTDFQNDDSLVTDYGDIMRWQALEVNDQTSGRTTVSDVWSYGTVMWEIVSKGAVPYDGVAVFDLPSYMRENQLPQPQGCSDELFKIMTTCWNKDPKMRPDMYVINSNLSEKLLEDSNEHISLDLGLNGPLENGSAFSSPNDKHYENFSSPSHEEIEDFTAL